MNGGWCRPVSSTTGATTRLRSSRRTIASPPIGRQFEPSDEFKTMVRSLHAAGLEVILDVVYNHTAEGDETGPTLSFRGIDNASYYRLDPHTAGSVPELRGHGQHARHALACARCSSSWTACVTGSMTCTWTASDSTSRPCSRASPTRSIRAPASARPCLQDPVLSRVKLIAEPWDIGPDGYHVGGFPAGWSEWNDRYRNTIRRFWSGERGAFGDLPTRLAGSSDLVSGPERRTPADREHQRRDDARRLHAGRSRRVQRAPQRSQRREQPGRRAPQPELELRRRGRDRFPGGARASATPTAQLPADA